MSSNTTLPFGQNYFTTIEWSLLPLIVFGVFVFIGTCSVTGRRWAESALSKYFKKVVNQKRLAAQNPNLMGGVYNRNIYKAVWLILVLHLAISLWMLLMLVSPTAVNDKKIFEGQTWQGWTAVFIIDLIIVGMIPLWSQLFSAKRVTAKASFGLQYVFLILFLGACGIGLAYSIILCKDLDAAATRAVDPVNYFAFQFSVFVAFTNAALSAWGLVAAAIVTYIVWTQKLLEGPDGQGNVQLANATYYSVEGATSNVPYPPTMGTDSAFGRLMMRRGMGQKKN